MLDSLFRPRTPSARRPFPQGDVALESCRARNIDFSSATSIGEVPIDSFPVVSTRFVARISDGQNDAADRLVTTSSPPPVDQFLTPASTLRHARIKFAPSPPTCKPLNFPNQ